MLKAIIASSLASLLILGASPAYASAGWYPTHKGEIITVDYCLPKTNMGPLILRAMGDQAQPIVLATIKPMRLPKDSYCADDLKYGFKQGLYHLKYGWRVNLVGGAGLEIYSPLAKRSYYGWPDGISSGTTASNLNSK